MNPLRKSNILRSLLETLKFGEDYPIPEVALRPQVSALCRPPITDEEWQEVIALASAPTKRLISQVESALDRTLVQWVITELGRSILATL